MFDAAALALARKAKLEELAVRRLNATELALSSVKMSAENYWRATHEKHTPQAYRTAILVLQSQLDADQAFLQRIRAIGR
jgi:hypothetical protein